MHDMDMGSQGMCDLHTACAAYKLDMGTRQQSMDIVQHAQHMRAVDMHSGLGGARRAWTGHRRHAQSMGNARDYLDSLHQGFFGLFLILSEANLSEICEQSYSS